MAHFNRPISLGQTDFNLDDFNFSDVTPPNLAYEIPVAFMLPFGDILHILWSLHFFDHVTRFHGSRCNGNHKKCILWKRNPGMLKSRDRSRSRDVSRPDFDGLGLGLKGCGLGLDLSLEACIGLASKHE